MSDENKANLPSDFTTTVEASDQTVQAVREQMPVGVAATPLDRIPLQPGLTALSNAGIYTKRIASTDRCIRVVDIPVKGGQVIQAHCSRACVAIGDMKLCPDHDKAAFQPNQTPHGTIPRVTNSASIPLSKAEEDELRETSKSYGTPAPSVLSPAPATVSAGISKPPVQFQKDCGEPPHDVKIYLSLSELSSKEILSVLSERICDALDNLPCGNVRQMKQIVAIQEKIARIGKVPRRRDHGITE